MAAKKLTTRTNKDLQDSNHDKEHLKDDQGNVPGGNNGGSDVAPEERKLIDQAFEPGDSEDEPIGALALDDRDDDGEQLNEKGMDKDLFGEDLDSPLTNEEEEEDGEA